MSIQGRTLSWLVIFGALTIALFGVGDYIQSTRALRFALELRARAAAQQAAEDIGYRYQRAETELVMLGYATSLGAVPPPVEGRYEQLLVLVDGVPAPVPPPAPAGTDTVAAGCGDAAVAFSVALAGSDGRTWRVEATRPVADLLRRLPSVTDRLGRLGYVVVLDGTDGSPVHDPNCAFDDPADRAGAVRSLAGAPASETADGVRVLAPWPGSDGAVLAAAPVPRAGWQVLAVLDYAEYAAPFTSLRRQYVAFISIVLLLALAVLLIALRHNMRRLAAIARAADEIGRGRFDVWLPPPTGDEIGRVSLALGRMVSRLSTTLKRVEVRRSMAAVGEMATYLSHEIRNPLSAIRLNLQMLRRDLARGSVPDDADELVGLCLSELGRLENVVSTVLEVGRTGRDAHGHCDAHAVVDETLQVMHGKFRDRRIAVERRLTAPDPKVAISAPALRGVVVNLLLNAMDALAEREGGRIVITSREVEDETGSRLELRIADNGPGVPEHLRDRIFDPFFTTKPTGHGIGLATAIRIAQECGGFLRCEQAGGGGAAFVLDVPLDRTATAAAASTTVAAGSGP